MLKGIDIMKNIEVQALEAMRSLLQEVPSIEIGAVNHELMHAPVKGYDIVIDIGHLGRNYSMVIEVKQQGQPRYVRQAIYQLRNYMVHGGHSDNQSVPVLIAPYLSPESRALCLELGVSYLDLFGNARVSFGSVYIDRAVANKPKTETRSLRSIFSPKASAILRVLLSELGKSWRVIELSEVAQVSLGHVSNVRKALLEREWVEEREGGIAVTNPNALLKTWREHYRRPITQTKKGYSIYHGSQLENILKGVLINEPEGARAVCSMQSAAKWIAPYGRDGTNTFYANEWGAEVLMNALALSETTKGENVVVKIVKDDSLFVDVIEPIPRLYCTSPVQTYLDLWSGNERDRESANVLAQECLPWLQ